MHHSSSNHENPNIYQFLMQRRREMGWIVSVGCIVQILCRLKVVIFHSQKLSTDTKDGEKNNSHVLGQ